MLAYFFFFFESLSIKTKEFYIQAKVAKRGAKHHERLPTHATWQSTHTDDPS